MGVRGDRELHPTQLDRHSCREMLFLTSSPVEGLAIIWRLNRQGSPYVQRGTTHSRFICSFTNVQLDGRDRDALFCISPIYSSVGITCIHHSECISCVSVHFKWRFGVCPVPLPVSLGIPPVDESIWNDYNQRRKRTLAGEIFVT